MTIKHIVEWFNKAVPQPTDKNFNTQIGCHIEEFVEMLDNISVSLDQLEEYDRVLKEVSALADKFKSGVMNADVAEEDRVDFLDGICDQFVTGTGLAVYKGMDIESAIEEVAASNNSKFDIDGNPIFNEELKIMKGPHYFKPDLRSFV